MLNIILAVEYSSSLSYIYHYFVCRGLMGQVGSALTAVVEGLESGYLDAATQHVRKGFSLRAAPGKASDADSAREAAADQQGFLSSLSHKLIVLIVAEGCRYSMRQLLE